MLKSRESVLSPRREEALLVMGVEMGGWRPLRAGQRNEERWWWEAATRPNKNANDASLITPRFIVLVSPGYSPNHASGGGERDGGRYCLSKAG